MINKRLLKIVQLIPESSIGVADIGTDHGYLPIKLVLNGFKGFIFASDIRPKPLNVAINNAKHYKVLDKITFSLSDGLDACDFTKIDTIVVAGMGGDLICNILDRAEWTMNNKYKFLLQPMSKPEILRYWLTNNGYSIINEYNVDDMGRSYSIIESYFTGVNEYYSDAQLYVGKNPSSYKISSTIKELEKKPFSKFNESIIEELETYDCI